MAAEIIFLKKYERKSQKRKKRKETIRENSKITLCKAKNRIRWYRHFIRINQD
jgi:hypothetical protein